MSHYLRTWAKLVIAILMAFVFVYLAIETVQAATAPSAPSAPTAVAGNKQATVTFVAPLDGGSAITSYIVTSTPDSKTCTANGLTATSCTVTGLTNGTKYTFNVAAINLFGIGAASPESAAITPINPPLISEPLIGDGKLVSKALYSSDGSKAFYVVNNVATLNSTIVMDYIFNDLPSEQLNFEQYERVNTITLDPTGANLYVATNKRTPIAPGTVSNTQRTLRINVSTFSVEAATAFASGGGYSQLRVVSSRNFLLGLSRSSQYLKKLDLVSLAQIGVTSPSLNDSSLGLLLDSTERYAYFMRWINLSNTPSCLQRFDVVNWVWANLATSCSGYGEYVLDEIALTGSGNIVAFEPSTRYGLDPKTTTIVKFSPSTLKAISTQTIPYVTVSAEVVPGGQYVVLAHYTTPSMSYGVSIFDMDAMAIVQTVTLGKTFIPSELAWTPEKRVRILQGNDSGIYRDLYLTDVPDRPTGVAGTFGDQSVEVQWTMPSYTGSSPVDSYVAYASGGTGKFCVSATTGCTITGLTNGVDYTFTVIAHNNEGYSPSSQASAAVTPATVPNAPTNVSAVINGDKTLRVSWTAPLDNGGASVTGYRVESVDSANSCVSAVGTQTYCDVSTLQPGQLYSFKVYATNKAGEGVGSDPSQPFAPVTKPGRLTGVSAIYGNSSAEISWTAPEYDGGTTILSYVVYASPGLNSCTVTYPTSKCRVNGLINGNTYTFLAFATNAVGSSTGVFSNEVIPRTTPGAPTSVIGSVGDNSVAVSWSAPTANGGATITGYTVVASPSEATCTTEGSTTCTITGLTNGTNYTFTVYATNSEGNGASSAPSAAVMPNVVPLAPASVRGDFGNGQVTVSWIAPISNGGTAITSYLAQTLSGSNKCTATGSSTSCVITGLTNGSSYQFKVKAQNSLGYGPFSDASVAVTPKTYPGAPTAVAGGFRDTAVYVQWFAPASTGGSPITGYTVTATPGGSTCTTTGALNCTVTGLTNGTSYTFKVIAINVVGNGIASLASAAVTPNVVPAAPSITALTYGSTIVDVTWSAPTANGGTSITSYYVESSPGSKSCTATTTTCRVSGLTNGISYTFKVRAINAAGSGAFSSSSVGVIPRTKPGAPRFASTSRGNGSYSFTIGYPVSDGGAVVTQYQIVSNSGNACIATPASAICTINDLVNGTSYTFTLTATNSEGTGASATFVGVPDAVPEAPTSPSAKYSNASALVTWTAPLPNGGTTLLSYKVTSSPGAKSCVSSVGATNCTVTGLTNGTAYTFSVQAYNLAGYSVPSASTTSVTPRLVPPSLTNVNATALDGAVLVEWDIPDSINLANISFQVVSSPGGATCVSSGSSCLVEKLANGNPYTFTVTPSYLTGGTGSPVSTISVSPGATPDEPTNVQAIGGYLGALVTWIAPADTGGLPIAAYIVTASPGEITCAVSAPSTSCSVTGLTHGVHYTFKVRARNAKGDGPDSLASSPVLIGETPDAPNSIYGIAGSNQVSVFWSAPLNTGGLDVTHYVATSTPGGFICVTSGVTRCVIGGLTNGVSYTFTVRAYTEFGPSAESIASSGVKPVNKNNQPSDISSMFLNATELRVVWSKVSSSGLAVNSYLVELTEETYPFETLESVSLPATEFTYVFTNLIENYGYQIRVTALDLNLDELGVLSLNDQNSPLPAMYAASSISGLTIAGSTLTSNFGSWMGLPVPTISRQWYACASQHESTSILPSDCLLITNAKSATFVATSTQANKYLMVGVTAINTAGAVVNFGATTATVVGVPPKITAAPKTKYPAKVLTTTTLNALTGSWTGGPTPDVTIQWQRCTSATKATIASPSICSDIALASGPSYTTSVGDLGKYIRYVVTATNIYGSAMYYAVSSTIVMSAPSILSNPEIAGLMNVGKIITATNGAWSGAPSFSYKWYKCTGAVIESSATLASGCVAISKATKSQYTIVTGDLNSYILVQITATNSAGSTIQHSAARRVVAP